MSIFAKNVFPPNMTVYYESSSSGVLNIRTSPWAMQEQYLLAETRAPGAQALDRVIENLPKVYTFPGKGACVILRVSMKERMASRCILLHLGSIGFIASARRYQTQLRLKRRYSSACSENWRGAGYWSTESGIPGHFLSGGAHTHIRTSNGFRPQCQ